MAVVERSSARPLPIEIKNETADQADILALFAASEAYMSALYPAESNHFVDAATLARPEATFLVARRNGIAIGCGAIVRGRDGCGEIKRMWVDPNVRRAQVGRRLLEALIDVARSRGLQVVRLETGVSQPEALALYRQAGFVECGPFGNYKLDPLSLFMTLTVSNVS